MNWSVLVGLKAKSKARPREFTFSPAVIHVSFCIPAIAWSHTPMASAPESSCLVTDSKRKSVLSGTSASMAAPDAAAAAIAIPKPRAAAAALVIAAPARGARVEM